VLFAAPGDLRLDTAAPQQPAVLVVVIAAVGVEGVGALALASALARDGANRVDQRLRLRDVVAVAASDRDGQWHTRRVDERVVLGTLWPTVNRGGTGQVPP